MNCDTRTVTVNDVPIQEPTDFIYIYIFKFKLKALTLIVKGNGVVL